MKHWLAAVLAVLLLLPLSGGQAVESGKQFGAMGQIHEKKGVNCTSCHLPTEPNAAAPEASCIKCHGDKEGKYAGTGRQYTFSVGVVMTANPHQSHLVALPCTECHKVHAASVNYCTQCHGFSDMKVK